MAGGRGPGTRPNPDKPSPPPSPPPSATRTFGGSQRLWDSTELDTSATAVSAPNECLAAIRVFVSDGTSPVYEALVAARGQPDT
jgi:hypothetical protein